MKGLVQGTALGVALVGNASAFVGTPLVRSSPGLGVRGWPGTASTSALMSMKTTMGPSGGSGKDQDRVPTTAAPFAVDFESVRDAFDGGDPLRVAGAGAAALAPLLMGVAEASAKGGEYGIVEGRTASFLHPVIMAALFAISLRSAKLGLDWRELRTTAGRMSELKEQLPMLSTGSRAKTPLQKEADTIRAQLEELGEDAADAAAGLKADLAKLASSAATEVEQELDAMSARRKELSSKNVRDRHYDAGALLLGLGTFAAIEGPVNTFLRAKKLFPGPHLYAGAGIVVAWAVAASLVPQMQKGNETARVAHMVINFGMIALFAWQIVTGIPIAQKVWEFTKFP